MKRESGSYDKKFNICVVGSSRIGKTSYIMRVVEDKYLASYNKTYGINVHIHYQKI
jgi:GTPase SAR1 family protein